MNPEPAPAAAKVVDLAVKRAKASLEHLERLLARAELAAEELETERAAAPKFVGEARLVREVLAEELLGQAMLRAQVAEIEDQVAELAGEVDRLRQELRQHLDPPSA